MIVVVVVMMIMMMMMMILIIMKIIIIWFIYECTNHKKTALHACSQISKLMQTLRTVPTKSLQTNDLSRGHKKRNEVVVRFDM